MIAAMPVFRQKLSAGKLCLGAGITLSDPATVEALGPSVDFLWIDLEHNPIGTEALLAHLIAARATNTPALTRVPSSGIPMIKRVLDIGVEGIIIPQIRSAAEARQAVMACRYAPLGARGYGPRRPSNYGRDGGKAYMERANRELFVCLQIETVEATQELDEILVIPGLDSIVLGPNDLSHSMGLPGDLSHPRVLAAVQEVIDKARAAGKFVGMGLAGIADQIERARRMGVQWIQCGNDFSYMIDRVESLFATVRERVT